MTKASATIKYVSVVLRETVRIALMIAALNDLKVKPGDILNMYIQAQGFKKDCSDCYMIVWLKISRGSIEKPPC